MKSRWALWLWGACFPWDLSPGDSESAGGCLQVLPGCACALGQEMLPGLLEDCALWSQEAPLALEQALGQKAERHSGGRVSGGGPSREAGDWASEAGQVLFRESHSCISIVNFHLSGEPLSRERGFSGFALAFPEQSMEDSMFLP